MEQKKLKKDQIGKLYNELVGEYDFYAPINKKGNIAFEKIELSREHFQSVPHT